MLKIRSLHIRNFYRIEEANLVFGDMKHCLVRGENGAGKSSIFEALSWGLFGQTARGRKNPGDSVLRPNSRGPVFVKVEIEYNKSVYEITRARKAAFDGDTVAQGVEAFLLVEKCGSSKKRYDLRGKDTAETEAVIKNLIGMDFETFSRTVYFPQEGVLPFGQLSDKVLKEFFLEKFLEVGWVADAHQKVKQDKQRIRGELDHINMVNSFLTQQLEEETASYESACQKHDEEESKNKESLKKLEADLVATSNLLEDARKELARVKQTRDLFVEKENKIREELDNLSLELIEYEKEIRAVQSRSERLQYGLTVDEDKADKILVEYKDLCDNPTKSVCPVCKRPFGEDIHTRLVGETHTKLELLKEAILKTKDEIAECDNKIARLTKKKEKAEKKISALKISYETLKEESNSVEYESLLLKVAELAGKKREREIAFKAADKWVNPYKQLKETLLIKINEKKKKKQENIIAQSRLEKELETVTFWELGFSTQGIQSFLLESITPSLNERLNYYLKILTGGVLTANFDTVTRLKTGEYREKFRFHAESKFGADHYSLLSGGEKKRCDIAAALSLADIRRSKSDCNLIVLDEVFTGLDSEGVKDVVELIEKSYLHKTVFVISHQEVDETFFNTVLRVEKKNGRTLIK